MHALVGDVRTDVLTLLISTDMLTCREWLCGSYGMRTRAGKIFTSTMYVLKLPFLFFDDLYAITQRDATFEDEERWITVGAIGPGSILLVVHTFYEEQGEEVIRVISARAAESHERKAYEEAHKTAEARHTRHRDKKRRRH